MSTIRANASESPERFSDDGVTTWDGRRVMVVLDEETAHRLAAAKRERINLGRDLLAEDAREVADPVIDALIAAGLGRR